MLVSFKFNCFKHGEFDHYFNSAQYPNRDFPLLTVICPEERCNRIAEYVPGINITKDTIGDGKLIESLGVYATSKNWLKRHLKTEGITQLTSDEVGHHIKQKSKQDRLKEHINSPAVEKERQRIISESMKECGID